MLKLLNLHYLQSHSASLLLAQHEHEVDVHAVGNTYALDSIVPAPSSNARV